MVGGDQLSPAKLHSALARKTDFVTINMWNFGAFCMTIFYIECDETNIACQRNFSIFCSNGEERKEKKWNVLEEINQSIILDVQSHSQAGVVECCQWEMMAAVSQVRSLCCCHSLISPTVSIACALVCKAPSWNECLRIFPQTRIETKQTHIRDHINGQCRA